MMKKDTDAQKALNELKAGSTWAELSRRLRMNKGYLSRVAKGTRPASNKLRVKLGLQPHTVEVVPLKCGHAPGGKRCAVCSAAKQRVPNTDKVIRVKKLRELLQSPYNMS